MRRTFSLLAFLSGFCMLPAQPLPEFTPMNTAGKSPLQIARFVADNIVDNTNFEFEYVMQPLYPDAEAIVFDESLACGRPTVAYALTTMFSEAEQTATVEYANWLLLGPFDNPGNSPDTVFEPEKAIVFHQLYHSGGKTFTWDIPPAFTSIPIIPITVSIHGLDVRIHHLEAGRFTKITGFAGIGKDVPQITRGEIRIPVDRTDTLTMPERATAQQRAYFQTSAVDATKIVSTLYARKSDIPTSNIVAVEHPGSTKNNAYIELKFKDGVYAIVPTETKPTLRKTYTANGWSFDPNAAAFVEQDGSILFVAGIISSNLKSRQCIDENFLKKVLQAP